MHKELSLDYLKELSLDGLSWFESVCNDYNLNYFLAFGTLIGAIRHKGFIPWDDDIDILMPRSDYERLIEISSLLEDDNWEVLSYKSTPGYLMPCIKICNKKTVVKPSRLNNGFLYGYSLDVFPLDFITADDYESAKRIEKGIREEIKTAINYSLIRSNIDAGINNHIRGLIKKIIFKSFRSNYNLIKRYLEIENEVIDLKGDNPEYAIYIYDEYASVWKIEDFFGKESDFLKTLNFEGTDYRVPVNVDRVLKESYGNYMELPPVEKRVSNHTYKAFLK